MQQFKKREWKHSDSTKRNSGCVVLVVNSGAGDIIPEWFSFKFEAIPTSYQSLHLLLWYWDEISFPLSYSRLSSFRFSILASLLALVSCKLKANLIPRWIPLSGASGVYHLTKKNLRHVCFDLGRKPQAPQPLWLIESNFFMWMKNELHSGTKAIPEWNSLW